MITLDHQDSKPLYQQIYEQFRDQIMDGSYSVGSKLPPIRTLADDLEVSRNTVEAAYLQLTQEGYVTSRTGSGFTVESLDLITEESELQRQEAMASFFKRLRQTEIWNEDEFTTDNGSYESRRLLQGRFELDDKPDEGKGRAYQKNSKVDFDFTYGNLQNGSFPYQVWRRLTYEVLSSADAHKVSTYTDNLGEKSLREEVAHMLHMVGGVNCHPSQVVIQAGTQASLYNLLQLFDPLRDVIAMEEPGYDGVRSVFENARFRIFPVPVYQGGSAFIDGLYNSRAQLAYVTPSNQFPTGRVLQLAARQQLLKWASTENAYIIEDDYCREFRYTTRPLPSLQSLDRDNRVIYMGTFSKVLSPALRMNFLVLPPDLLFQWHKLYSNHYPEVPWLNQAVLAECFKSGFWTKHLRRAQAMNKRKYHLLINALQRYMGERVDIMENGSGLHLLVGVLDGRNHTELISAALQAGVKVYGINRYWMTSEHPMENYVLVGFSAIDEKAIDAGIKRLAEAWFA